MKAKIISQNSNALQPSNKETVNVLNVVGTHKGEVINPVTARFYMGRSSSASVVYCNLWVHGPHSSNLHTSGRGSAGGGGYHKESAGGGGYHKESAALQEAITSAGIELYGSAYWPPRKGEAAKNERPAKKNICHIGGVGSSAMETALLAIARAAGFRGKLKVIGG